MIKADHFQTGKTGRFLRAQELVRPDTETAPTFFGPAGVGHGQDVPHLALPVFGHSAQQNTAAFLRIAFFPFGADTPFHIPTEKNHLSAPDKNCLDAVFI
jgi:hypothetical protein